MRVEFKALVCKGVEGRSINLHNHLQNPSLGETHFQILSFETKSRDWSMGTTIPDCKQYSGGS
jgi:hypothetical protein